MFARCAGLDSGRGERRPTFTVTKQVRNAPDYHTARSALLLLAGRGVFMRPAARISISNRQCSRLLLNLYFPVLLTPSAKQTLFRRPFARTASWCPHYCYACRHCLHFPRSLCRSVVARAGAHSALLRWRHAIRSRLFFTRTSALAKSTNGSVGGTSNLSPSG